MQITLRINNDSLVPVVPPLDENNKNRLIAKTKGDTLTYSEMDANFIYIMEYLVDVYNKVKSIKTQDSNVNPLTRDDLTPLETKINQNKDNITNIVNNLIPDIKSKIEQKVDQKFNKLKTINNQKLISEDNTTNITIDITDEQFKNHLIQSQFGSIGSIGLFKIKSQKLPGSSYSGSELYYPTQGNPESTINGTWRCLGAIDNVGLFMRII